MKKITIFCCVFFILAFSSLCVFAEEDISVEQVQITMPEVNVYLYSEEKLQRDDFNAYLQGEKLTVEGVETCEEITYIFMVDSSASVNDGQMEAIRKTLLNFAQNKSENEAVILISFGKKIETLLYGNENAEQITAAINSLDNHQDSTVFYEAVNRAVEMSNDVYMEYPERKVVVIFSDGIDVNRGGMSKEEIIEKLRDNNLPIYAFGLYNGYLNQLDSFGEIARKTSGKMEVVTESTLEGTFSQVIEYIRSFQAVKLKASTNIASGQKEKLALSVSFENKSVEKEIEVTPRNWIPDTLIPHITEWKKLSANSFSLTFNKNLSGADNKDNFKLTNKAEEEIKIESAVYEESNFTCVLTLAEPVYKDDYTLSFFNITDISMEKNILSANYLFKGEGQSLLMRDFLRIAGHLWWVLVIIIVVVGLAVIYSTVKKKKAAEPMGREDYTHIPNYGNGEITVEPRKETKYKYESPKTKNIRFYITDMKGICKEMSFEMEKSFFVGRSDMCNLFFDDKMLSRQHFVIEEENGEFFITDLNTTNGTYLNGVRLINKRKLQNGDAVTAGQEKFVYKV